MLLWRYKTSEKKSKLDYIQVNRKKENWTNKITEMIIYSWNMDIIIWPEELVYLNLFGGKHFNCLALVAVCLSLKNNNFSKRFFE